MSQPKRITNRWKKGQQSLDLDSQETWMLTHFYPRTKCNNPAPPLTPRRVPVGCTKVLPPSKNGRGANTEREKALRATRRNFGQGGNRGYSITTMAKREAERKKKEEAAMKEVTEVLEKLFRHIDNQHRRSR